MMTAPSFLLVKKVIISALVLWLPSERKTEEAPYNDYKHRKVSSRVTMTNNAYNLRRAERASEDQLSRSFFDNGSSAIYPSKISKQASKYCLVLKFSVGVALGPATRKKL